MSNEILIKYLFTIFLGFIITVGVSKECLFLPNVINI